MSRAAHLDTHPVLAHHAAAQPILRLLGDAVLEGGPVVVIQQQHPLRGSPRYQAWQWLQHSLTTHTTDDATTVFPRRPFSFSLIFHHTSTLLTSQQRERFLRSLIPQKQVFSSFVKCAYIEAVEYSTELKLTIIFPSQFDTH